VITCQKCGKDNQDHYKFCLGCGAELPRDASPKQFNPKNTPPQGMAAAKPAAPVAMADPFAAPPPAVAAAPTQVAAPAPSIPRPVAASAPAPAPAPVAPPPPSSAAASAGGPCPQCGHVNPGGMRFCMSCGFNLAAASLAPPAPVAAAPAAGGGVGGAILTALRADKSEVGSYTLHQTTTVGRDTGGIFAGDSYLSPRHATFAFRTGKFFVKDESSLNGTFIKLTPEVPVDLRPGDIFRIGQEIIRFEALVPQPPSPDGVERLGSPSKGYVGRLALIIGRDVTGNAFPVPEAGIHLGRERGDILFPEDGYVSGLHCRIRVEGGRVTLTDLGSSNGTFIRLTAERELKSTDELLMGQQLFRIAIQ
jgi:pSer/pThr/pTyr-binding forkhead associated (FHA) protein